MACWWLKKSRRNENPLHERAGEQIIVRFCMDSKYLVMPAIIKSFCDFQNNFFALCSFVSMSYVYCSTVLPFFILTVFCDADLLTTRTTT